MPDGLSTFFRSSLPVIYGLYGLAIFMTGVAVWLESGRASQLALNRAMPFLAAFGLTHGVHEWIEMYALAPATTGPIPAGVATLNVALLAISFVFLSEFALRLMRLLEPARFGKWAWLPFALSALYFMAVAGYRASSFAGDEALFWRVADILSRYTLGVPAAVLACTSMFIQRRAFLREGYAQFSRDFIGAALAFAWYAIFQFIVPPSPYFPSSEVNTSAFLALTGLPVQLFRAAVVAVLAFFVLRVLRVFEIEYARRLEALNRERFAAEENAARELKVLYETCRILGTTLDLNFILNEALNRIVSLVEPVCAGTIFLCEEGETTLLSRATYQHPAVPLPPEYEQRARTLAQRAFETQDIAYEPPLLEHLEHPTSHRGAGVVLAHPAGGVLCHLGAPGAIRIHGGGDEPAKTVDGILALPLVSGGNAIGALCLAQEGSFSNFAILQTLARQLVIAIENARLYEQVQQKELLRGQLLERVVTAQEEERKRLARDLHDQTGQRLTGLALGLSSVNELWERNPAQARERLKDLEQLTAGAIDDLRQFVSDLRPALLDDLGLVAAVREMAKQTAARSGVEIEFRQSGRRRRLRAEIETVLYRIAQEALNNTVRHAQACRASVDLEFGERSVSLTIQDNGIGFAAVSVLKPQAQIRAWGLLGMQERVALVGGKLEIQSAPGRGTCLIAEVPLESMEERRVNSGFAR